MADADYWDDEDADDEPQLRCQCNKHPDFPCQRGVSGDKLCATCQSGKCAVFHRPGQPAIHSRGLSRGRKGPAAKHARDLRSTLDQLAAEHELDEELGGEMTVRNEPPGGVGRTLGDIRSLPTWHGDE